MINKLLNRISWICDHMKEKEQVLLLRGEEIDTVKRTLEKQIPKKPYYCKTSGGQNGHMCSNCHRILDSGYPQHCEFCGQAIDWSDEE
ncbi:MAG: hypothetical protein MJ097_00540 [Dorea sp.]|nr:hypothetical protein [Dorea sp.]